MSWLSSSIRNKILAVLLLGITTLVATALYGIAAAWLPWRMVSDTLIVQAVETEALESTFKEQVNQWMSVLVRGHEEKSLEKSWKQFTFREREVRRAAEKLRDAAELPAARELLVKFLESHQAMGDKYRRGLEAFKASNFDARAVDASTRGIDGEPGEQLEELVKMMRDEAQSGIATARAQATQRLIASLIGIVLATVIAVSSCAILIMRTVVRPLRHAVSVVDRVAAGDLTVDVHSTSRDETGRLLDGLRRMRDDVSAAVHVIRSAAEGVDSASRQMSDGFANLSARTEEEAAALEETSASMHELATAVRHNSENAREANQFTSGASQVADQGGRAMADVVVTMGDIAQSSSRISEIAALIDSIAFQTNILALNAAVEAARAGEQGRGFAVVAAEVRALAHRSAAAARDVKQLIDTSGQRVAQGRQLVENAGLTIGEIVTSVQRASEMVSAIARAGDEQLSGIEQVSATVTQMDRAVQQNAALVSESAVTAARLAQHAGQLVESVAHFRLAGDGSEELPTDPAPAQQARGVTQWMRAALPAQVGTEKKGIAA